MKEGRDWLRTIEGTNGAVAERVQGEEKLLTAEHGRGDLQEDNLQGLALYALGVARLGPYRSCHLLIDAER